jgi:hypothetical protein
MSAVIDAADVKETLDKAEASSDPAVRAKAQAFRELGASARAVQAAREAIASEQRQAIPREIPLRAALDRVLSEGNARIADARRVIAEAEGRIKAAEDALQAEQEQTQSRLQSCQEALSKAEERERKAEKAVGLAA